MRGLLLAALACAPAAAEDRLLSAVPEGWTLATEAGPEADRVPRIAFSRDLQTVLSVASGRDGQGVLIGGELVRAERVDEAVFTRDGLTPVLLLTDRGRQRLRVGARVFGPYDSIDRPAMTPDGSRVVFRARDGGRWLVVDGGTEAARGKDLTRPVLSADGRRAAFWRADGGRLELVLLGPEPPPDFARAPLTAPAPDAGEPVFSADGRHLAYWVRSGGGRARVVRDGAPGPEYFAVGEPVWSPDGSSLAYGASLGPDPELHMLVQDGEETRYLEPAARESGAKGGEPRRMASVWGWRWLGDGRLTYFARLSSGRNVLVVDGKPTAEFDSVSGLSLDPQGRRLAFVAAEGKRSAAVIDGKVGPFHDEVNFIHFDPTGRRVAYTARDSTGSFVVADGVPGPAYGRVGWTRWSPDGRSLAYSARRGLAWAVVLDGNETFFGLKTGLIGNLVLAGPQGRTPALSTYEDDGWHVRVGGRSAGPFDAVSHFLDEPSGSLRFATLEGREFRLRSLPVP